MSIKFCKDCKHSQFNKYHTQPDPMCVAGHVRDLVTGEQIRMTCRENRKDENACGSIGKWFEPKESPAPMFRSSVLCPRCGLDAVHGDFQSCISALQYELEKAKYPYRT